jgi:hypothetical protein
MTMIKLPDGCYVAAEQIAEVKVNDSRTHITVRTKDGICYCHEPRYGVYAALNRLVTKINAATSNAGIHPPKVGGRMA